MPITTTNYKGMTVPTPEPTGIGGSLLITDIKALIDKFDLVPFLAGTNTFTSTNTFSGSIIVPTQSGGDNTTKAASTAFVTNAVGSAVVGLYKLKGSTDASTNPNYPAASAGDAYVVTVAGKVGGASGVSVDANDTYIAIANNAGGTQAAVGASWIVMEHNLVGALLAANNLSDVANGTTSLTNLGGIAPTGTGAVVRATSPTISGPTISGSIGFGASTGDKLLLYSNTFGLGIEANTITTWTTANHRWRIGGTSASTGTEYMLLNTTGLTVSTAISATGLITSPAGFTTSEGGQAGVGTNKLTTREYVQSRLQNLLTNNSGLLLDNYNFTSFTFDSADTHGGAGSYRINVNASSVQSDELIPVDPTLYYRLSGWGKSGDVGGGNYNAANIQYLGISSYDIDGLLTNANTSVKVPGSTDTTLTVALTAGATTMTVANATGWHNGSTTFQRHFVWWPYTNSKGYTYPDYTYTRNASQNYIAGSAAGSWAAGGISGNVITLLAPWTGPTLAIGTKVRDAQNTISYNYVAAAGVTIPNAWTKYEGYMGPADYYAGTAYVKLLFLINYHGAADNNVRWSDLWLGEATHHLYELQLKNGTQGANKVMVSDANGNATWSSSSTVTELQFHALYNGVQNVWGYDIQSSPGVPVATFDGNATTGEVRIGALAASYFPVFYSGGSARWQMDTSGNMLASANNSYDIGASGTSRPRTIYVGTSIITPSLTDSGLTSTRVTFAGTGGLLSDSANLTFGGQHLTLATGSAIISTQGQGVAWTHNSIYEDASSNLVFQLNNASSKNWVWYDQNASATRMTLTELGALGVGVSPSVKFEADGKVRSDRAGVAAQYVELDGGDSGSMYITSVSVGSKSFVIANSSSVSAGGRIIRFDIGGSPVLTLNNDLSATFAAGITLTTPLAVTSGGTGISSVATGNVLYATGTNTLAAGSPDTAGLVDKGSTQTITGAKTFSNATQIGVSGAASDTVYLSLFGGQTGVSDGSFAFEIGDSGATGLSTKNMLIRGGSAASDIAFAPASGLITTPSLVLKAGGFVGIGTSSPNVKLEVAGGNGIRLQGAASDPSYYTTLTSTYANPPVFTVKMVTGGGAEHTIMTITDNTVAANITTVFNVGNVGIGTTSPASLLDLFGSATQTYSANTTSAGATKRSQASIATSWINSVEGSQTGRLIINGIDWAATREAIRIDTTGSTAQVSIGGAVSGSAMFTVNGSATILTGIDATTYLRLGGTTGPKLTAVNGSSDITLSNNGVTDFGLLKFGGTTSSFPALKKSATSLQVRLADDSDYGSFASGTITVKQPGGVGGTDEAQISHDGTNIIIKNMNDSSGSGRCFFQDSIGGLLPVTFVNARFGSSSGNFASSLGVGLGSSGVFSWNSNSDGSGNETSFGRFAANSVYLRGDSATSVAPTFELQGKSTTTSGRAMYDQIATWIDSTDASRKSRITLNIYDTAIREAIRMDATGAAAQVAIAGAVNGSDTLTVNGTIYSTGNATVVGGQVTIFDSNVYVRRNGSDGYGEISGLNGSALLQGGARRLTVSNTIISLTPPTQGTAANIVDVVPGSLTNSTGTMVTFAIRPTYNQTSVAAATDLLINRTQTAIGSGAQLLIDAQVATVSKFNVTNAGNTYLAGSLGIGTTSPVSGFDLFASVGGVIQSFTGNSSTSTKRIQADITPSWIDSTDATRKARLDISIYDNVGQRPAIRIDANGTSAQVGIAGVVNGTSALTVNGDTYITGTITAAGGIPGTASATSLTNIPRWIKTTKTFTDLAAAATTNSITLFTLPAGGIIHGIKVKHSTVFNPTTGTYTLTVGVSGQAAKYCDARVVSSAPSSTDFFLATVPMDSYDHASTKAITITATTTTANLNTATTGSVDVWLLVSEAV